MIFGFKKKAAEEAVEEEYDLVKFRGALNGRDPKLEKAARLVDVGLIPAKDLVTDGLLRRAEMVRIDPKGAQSQVTLSIDGVAYSGGRMGKQQTNAVIQMLKLLAGLDIKVRNRPQAGGIKAELGKTKYELNLQVTPVSAGERLVIRTRNLGVELNSITDLGGTDEFRLKLREMMSQHGFLGIVGPPHSGTSSTAHAVMRGLDAFLNQMFTLGDIGSVEMENIPAFETDDDKDFEAILTRCFRQEADIVFLNKLEDAQTAKTFLKFHTKGGLVSEFAAPSAAAGLAQLVTWTKDPQLVADSVRGIISQKLVRRLCDQCKQVFRPNPKFLTKAGLSKDLQQLCRPAPRIEGVEDCEKCDGIGYYGRLAMFEMIEMTDAMKELILTSPKPEQIQALVRKEKMQTLQKDGLRLVSEGQTSLDELQRVFRPKKK